MESEIEEEFGDIYNNHDGGCPEFNKVGGNIDGKFIMTYGGGPEGGYVITPDDRIFQVNRNWFTKWVCDEISGILVERHVDWGLQVAFFEDIEKAKNLVEENDDLFIITNNVDY